MTRYGLTNYLYIFLTIFFTVYGQIVMKWRLNQLGPLPEAWGEKSRALIMLLFDPYIFSSYFAAFLASLAWMITMTKFPLSHAYPFMSLNFVIVLALTAWLLAEPVTLQRCAGFILIMLGTVVAARG